MKATLIRDLLTDLLAAAVDVVTDPPERRYVAHGETFAHDCELLASSLVSVRAEQPEPALGAAGCTLIPVVTMRLTILRCYPKLEPEIPAAAEIQAAAVVLADDAVALSGGILDKWSAGTLFPTAGIHCDRVSISDLLPISPSGGLAGWRIGFDVRT